MWVSASADVDCARVSLGSRHGLVDPHQCCARGGDSAEWCGGVENNLPLPVKSASDAILAQFAHSQIAPGTVSRADSGDGTTAKNHARAGSIRAAIETTARVPVIGQAGGWASRGE